MTGGSRFLSLTKKPFFLPQPLLKIKDFPVLEEMPRYLYLYKKEDLKNGIYQIIIYEIPYQVNKIKIIEQLANLINTKN